MDRPAFHVSVGRCKRVRVCKYVCDDCVRVGLLMKHLTNISDAPEPRAERAASGHQLTLIVYSAIRLELHTRKSDEHNRQ